MSFLGIEIAKKALFAHQRAQQNVSHNIANANTPGYSRQRVVLEATYSACGIGNSWQLGTGVKASDVERIREEFLDMQYRDENSILGEWDIQSDLLSRVETVFNEPSDLGISSVFNKFWESLETLSKDAGSQEARETVKERAINLADTLNHVFNQLSQIQGDIDFRISTKVDEVNNLAAQIAHLNGEIRRMEITGVTAADLRDQRDVLLDKLSTLVNFNSYEDENGTFTVNVGSILLVKGTECATLEFEENEVSGNKELKWKDYGTDLKAQKGELIGLTNLKAKIDGYVDQLETFNKAFVYEFNSQHAEGYDLEGNKGGGFFEFEAHTLKVSEDIINNPSLIAAAESPNGIPGDNRNVLKLANIRNKTEIKTGTGEDDITIKSTLDDYYGALISKIGVDSQAATRMKDSQEYMVSQLEERRKMVSGVSLDEEMVNMVMNQHAYNAAARVLTAVDEMLEIVVNRLGLVGR